MLDVLGADDCIAMLISQEDAVMDVMTTIPPAERMTNEASGNDSQPECPVHNPQANPSTETKGDNSENDLYEIWKASDEISRPEVETYLLPHLRRHAAKVCWMVLHSHQPHLIDEIAQDALMELKQFEGRSMFSTWFHSRALYRAYNERRTRDRRKEISFSNLGHLNLASQMDSDVNMRLDVERMLTNIDSKDVELVRLKIAEGMTDDEIAASLGIPRANVQYRWQVLREKLRTLYNGRHTVE
jgi:RNA polymerase sigma factor (sigma-70 family)